MPETPNHGYNVPDEGEQNWHEPLNENFEQYDTDIEIRDKKANLGNYDPKAGAKYLATDTGNVYIGDGSQWRALATFGPSPSFDELNPSNNFLGVARSVPITDAEYFGVDATVKPGDFGGMYVNAASESARPFYGYATADASRLWHHYDGQTGEWRLEDNSGTRLAITDDGRVAIGGQDEFEFLGLDKLYVNSEGENNQAGTFVWAGSSASHDGSALYADNTGDSGDGLRAFAGGDCRAAVFADALGQADHAILAEGDVTVNGDFEVSGNKNFVQSVDTDAGEKEVVYTATEAGTPHTEASGVAELDGGRAEVDLPEHFAWVTSEADPLMVQTTPYGGSAGLKVVERSTDRIVVEALDAEGDYEFAYTVKGTRKGHGEKQVVREPSAADSATNSTERRTADD